MAVYGMFYGGTNYSFGDITNLEEFSSIQDAKDTLQYRYRGNDSYFPVVTETACMYVYLAKPTELDNPDRVYAIGPRGGIRREL